jgi:L-alanine-DL-glutamate epimerase-like enolase superfamily enzyme
VKITNVTVRLLEVPLPEPGFRPAWSPGQIERVISTTMAEVQTDDGLVGLAGNETIHHRAMAETIAGSVGPQLIGKDPLDTECCIDVIRRADRFGAAPWWLEMALWDLVGKVAGLPIWRMWGGGASRLLAYASTGEVRSPAERAESCVRLVESGFRAIKLRIHGETVREDVAIVEAVRRAVGPDVALMVDANQGLPTTPRWTFRRALDTCAALAPLGITWLEEPLDRHAYADLGALRSRSAVPIAGGETNQDPDEYVALLQHRAFDVLQPDVTLAEGMWGLRLLSRLAEIHGVPVVPHTWSSPFGLVANCHLAASLPSCPYLEYPHDPPIYTAERFAIPTRPMLQIDAEGYIAAPTGPGLGIELDREQVERCTVARFDVK